MALQPHELKALAIELAAAMPPEASKDPDPDPQQYDAKPKHGSFTGDSSMHLWCAHALACVVASRDQMEEWNDDIQDGLRYLLQCELARAKQAQLDESLKRASRAS